MRDVVGSTWNLLTEDETECSGECTTNSCEIQLVVFSTWARYTFQIVSGTFGPSLAHTLGRNRQYNRLDMFQ